MWNLRDKTKQQREQKREANVETDLTIVNKLMVIRGVVGMQWIKLLMIMECTCDEHRVLYGCGDQYIAHLKPI